MVDSMELIAAISVITAAAFWIVTQWNVIRTKNILVKRAEKSWTDVRTELDTRFIQLETLIETKIKSIPIPDLDLEPIKADLRTSLDGLRNDLAATFDQMKGDITTSVVKTYASQKSAATRQLQKELKTLTPGIEALEGEVMAQLQDQIDPTAMIMQQIMTQDVTEEFAETHPIETLMLRAGKAEFLKRAKDLMPGKTVSPTVQGNYSPGLKR